MTPLNRPMFSGRQLFVGFVALASVVSVSCQRSRPPVGPPVQTREQRLAQRGQEEIARVRELDESAAELSSLREQAIELLEDAAIAADPQTRVNAIEALTLVPSRLDGVIGAALVDDNLGVRSVAAVAAGRARLTGHDDALRAMLADESPFVQASAVYALVRSGAEIDRSVLADLVLTGEDTGARAHAAFILGELGDRSAIPLLRQAGQERSKRASRAELRLLWLQLAEAVVKLGDERPLHGIRAALYPGRPEELEATALAVQILGEIQDRGAIDQLIYMSGFRDTAGNLLPPEIRLGIAAALARMGLQEGGFIADEYWRSRRPAERALSADVYGWTERMEHLARLERMMEDRDGRVRISAAAGVVRIIGAR